MSAAFVYTPQERASRRLGLFLLLIVGLLLTMTLFFVKTRAQDARADVSRLEAEIARQEAAIIVLTAEKSVLTNHGRLRNLSEKTLSLKPITTEGTVKLKALEGEP